MDEGMWRDYQDTFQQQGFLLSQGVPHEPAKFLSDQRAHLISCSVDQPNQSCQISADPNVWYFCNELSHLANNYYYPGCKMTHD